jgi:hypothetical protein
VEVDRITGARAALEGVAVVTPPSAGQRIWAVTLEPGVAAPPVRSAMLSLVAAQALPMTSIREIVPSLEDVYRRAVGRTGRGREVAA